MPQAVSTLFSAPGLSYEEGDVVSINSEGFNDRDNNIDEDVHVNELCDICHLTQPPSETVKGRTWIIFRCNAVFHSFCGWDAPQQFLGFHCLICGAIKVV